VALPSNVPTLVDARSKPGKLRFNFHYGQALAWNATERFVAIVAGTQSGKTTFGPLWLRREISLAGPGDYLIAAPTDPLLQVKLIPAFRQLFEEYLKLGKFTESPRPKFTLSRAGERALFGSEQDVPTNVYFGYAAKPDSLESMTVKAAWLDEAGQPEFKSGSWDAILRRLSLSMGRVLITTTPYTVGHWLRRRVFDKRNDPQESIRVVQFKSLWNPEFPLAEWERAKRDLPRWKFRMMYHGEFAKPAGQIYDVFGEEHVVPRFAIPERWVRYAGIDFGGVNTAAVFLAERPEDKALFAYRVYHNGFRTAAQHAEELKRNEPRVPVFYGGAKSEAHYRLEYRAGGLLVKEPLVPEVEQGIDRVYAQLANVKLFVFDDLEPLLDEFDNYSRKTDSEGNVSELILDKNTYHHLDALRYIIGSIRGAGTGSTYTRYEPEPFLDENTAFLRDNYYGN
jgi:hypothetical protein